MPSVLYLTHCTYKKDKQLKAYGKTVSPDVLYVGVKITRFINRCKKHGVNWAIFSDKYGVWFPDEKHAYYEKHPKQVTDLEFQELVTSATSRLIKYDKVYFYGNHNSHYFHPLYKKLIEALRRDSVNVVEITALNDIRQEFV